jgi:CRISPR/Cas system Type II protein with McrA/HNH and RuvC-like nuclease domain
MGNSFRKLVRRIGCDPRKQLTPKRAFEIYERCQGCCFYCDKTVVPFTQRLHRWEIDHVISRAHGGTDTTDNLVVACFHCNRMKHDKTLAEFCIVSGQFPRCRKLVETLHDTELRSFSSSKKDKNSEKPKSHFCANRVASLSTRYCETHHPCWTCCFPCCVAP